MDAEERYYNSQVLASQIAALTATIELLTKRFFYLTEPLVLVDGQLRFERRESEVLFHQIEEVAIQRRRLLVKLLEANDMLPELQMMRMFEHHWLHAQHEIENRAALRQSVNMSLNSAVSTSNLTGESFKFEDEEE